MRKFWKQSPEWQRELESRETLDEAGRAKNRTGEAVLFCVLHDAVAPSGAVWEKARRDYKEAYGAWEAACDAWAAALRAYKISPAGQAEARYRRDPLARDATESEAVA